MGRRENGGREVGRREDGGREVGLALVMVVSTHAVQLALLDEVQQSLKLFPQSHVPLVHPQHAGPAPPCGARVVHRKTVAVKLDGEHDGFGVGVIVSRGTGVGFDGFLSVFLVTLPQCHLHLPRTQHVPICMYIQMVYYTCILHKVM